jgi:GTP-binding protein EngB required for normal cell division
MVGRTRSGKSTAVGVLKNPCFQPEKMSIFSQTRGASLQSFAIVPKEQNMKMTFNMIDTPGLFEVVDTEEKRETRNNDQLIRVINQCMEMEITKVHCVVVFASFETGINKQDLEAIAVFREIFAGCNMRLCITRTEDKPTGWRQRIQTQIQKIPELKDLSDHILWMGCYDQNLKPAETPEKADRLYRKIYQMRKNFLTTIFNMNEPTQLKKLGLYKHTEAKYGLVLSEYHEVLNMLVNTEDHNCNKIQQAILGIESLTEIIADDCKVINNLDFGPQLAQIFDTARKLRDKVEQGKMKQQHFDTCCGFLRL